jgi:hypothetical protein
MKRINFSIILFLAGLAVLPFSVLALTVSPPRIEITGDPGHTVTGTYFLINEEADTRTFYSSFANFEASGESGVPKFLETQEGLAVWLETQPQITLQPREEREIPFSIKIPQNAEPGGHFAAIFWGTSAPVATGGGTVSIGGKVGILVLLRISGEVEGKAGLLEFAAKDGKRVFASLPIEFIWRFRNDSGNRIQPEGEITIKNTFGLTTAKLPANKGLGGILPASIRKFSVLWLAEGTETGAKEGETGFFAAVKNQWSEFHFGWYKAYLNLQYANGGQSEAKLSFSFWIIPWQLLSVIIVILGIVGFLGMIGLKRYNRWIIAKAQKSV